MTYDELVKDLRENHDKYFARDMQAADAIEELSHEYEKLAEDFNGAVELLHKRSEPRWIPVTERLPEKMQYVLVRYKNNDMAVVSWVGGDEDIRFWRAIVDEGWCADCDTEPTHWMPLPSTEGLNET